MANKHEFAMTNRTKEPADKSNGALRATKRPAKGDAGVGRRAELLDHERAIGRPITYADDRHPMQAAPDHGPHK
jgi:hypothetical protein